MVPTQLLGAIKKEQSGMKVQWCWRCKADVPMLDEDEYAQVEKAIRAMKSALNVAVGQGRSAEDVPEVQQFLQTLERVAGGPIDVKAFMSHPNLHRISKCGQPCRQCGKVLRTPTASRCFECGCSSRKSIWRRLLGR